METLRSGAFEANGDSPLLSRVQRVERVDRELRDDDELAIASAISLAAELLGDIAPTDARIRAIVQDRAAADFTLTLTDNVIRAPRPTDQARAFGTLVKFGVPTAFALTDRVLLHLGAIAVKVAPTFVMRLVRTKVRRASRRQVVPAEARSLKHRLGSTHGFGGTTNVNLLGEAIIGEHEAIARRDRIVALVQRSDVDAVSVKVSAIASNISALAFDATVERLIERVRPIYEAALARACLGNKKPALVTLDMEEFRDLDVTAALFERILGEPQFNALEAGIVLQAYLPDSHRVAEALCSYARRRVATGGAPIRIRLVKGANLAMERVEAEQKGWPLAPYGEKIEVDASYKLLLDTLLSKENDAAVNVGLASHNLFDIAWGLGIRERLATRNRASRLEFETLEGMATGLAAALARKGAVSLVYSPIVGNDSFTSAIAYLVRRLDENTTPENFLHALVDLAPNTEVFRAQASQFSESVRLRHTVCVDSHRSFTSPKIDLLDPRDFANEPDTDFACAGAAQAVSLAVQTWTAPDQIAFVQLADVDHAVEVAVSALAGWTTISHSKRAELLRVVARRISEKRNDVVALMAHEASKTIAQGDPEVSEAIDFANYYAMSADELSLIDPHAMKSSARGVVVIAPPWNFPFAIVMGGICAALAAGNTVIVKPAPQAMLSAHKAVLCCWEAGVPRDVLQFLPCADDNVGQRLIAHPEVSTIILTGSIDTARMFLAWRPKLTVLAETSGKNALVIGASADIDLALKDLVTSAFGHAGQKCSAASLAILADCWYDDPAILERLADAVRSLKCGSAIDPSTDIAPMVQAPSPHLLRALTVLQPGEQWLVKPEKLDTEGRHWSPGIIIGVAPGSWFQRTECFGPVLGIMRATNIEEALQMQNGSDFGLTAGLHSLDEAELATWTEQVEAGNLYINRSITGAIVQRQPFGGWKQSSVGPGAKAGGPNYVALLRTWHSLPEHNDTARDSFLQAWSELFSVESDPTGLVSERNVLRYRPLRGGVVVRVGGPDTASDNVTNVENFGSAFVETAHLAAQITGTRLVVSTRDDETDDDFSRRLQLLGVDRLRLVGTCADAVRRCAHENNITVDDAPITANGRIELLHWLREQTVSRTMHRHGHVNTRSH
jgi:RHH-type transcriptional regulator, proline utilization regulon repressor / proline dehydrogenase / delta 1-pyrroline-5-carboxylate dehydrogenase